MTAGEDRWRRDAEDLCRSPTFRADKALGLVSEIIKAGSSSRLVEAARQALPVLRRGAAPKADEWCRALARRRFALVRQALAPPAGPTFGRRAAARRAAGPSSLSDAEWINRRLLGLAFEGDLSGPAIAAAFREAAKTAHPDRGGTTDEFARLVAARDALIDVAARTVGRR